MSEPCQRCERCGLDLSRSVPSRILSAATIIIAVCALVACAFVWWVSSRDHRFSQSSSGSIQTSQSPLD